MTIQILVDNSSSWILPYAQELVEKLSALRHTVSLHHNECEIVEGDILCLLACEKIFKKLHMNKHNLVVHESDLPKGKGWSPVSWQVLEGKNSVTMTLFEATGSVDDGPIYYQTPLELEGHELWSEIKHKQGLITQQLIIKFVHNYPNNIAKPQAGVSTFYQKRTPKDSELDIYKSIEDQFNLLRICDNERYPAFFVKGGQKYILKIEKG